MNGAFTPIAIAQVVARNIVPLVGILVFHWSAGNVLLLYLLDTLLSMAVIFAGLMSTFSPPPDDEGVSGWINSEAGWLVVMMVTYFILEFLPPNEPVLLILVVANIAGSIFAEIAPDRFLRAMPGGADNLEPDASSMAGPADRRGSGDRDRRGKR
jgi:hypothetical protein